MKRDDHDYRPSRWPRETRADATSRTRRAVRPQDTPAEVGVAFPTNSGTHPGSVDQLQLEARVMRSPGLEVLQGSVSTCEPSSQAGLREPLRV